MKKKILVLALMLALTAGVVPFYHIDWPTVSAASATSTTTSGKCGDNLTWTFDDSTGVLTISGKGVMYDYGSDGNRWSEPTSPWGAFRESVKSVKFVGNITSIGNSAFAGCSNLNYVDIPDSITRIGNYAFSECYVEKIVIPDNVVTIGDYVFSSGDPGYDVSEIVIGKSVKTIGEGAFAGFSCDYVKIPSNVKKIGAYAFVPSYENENVYVDVPDSITDIGMDAFRGTANMFGNHVKYTYDSSTKTAYLNGSGPMYDNPIMGEGVCGSVNENTETVVVGEGVTHVGCFAFYGKENITEVKLSQSVTSIGDRAFIGCNNLKSLTIPKTVTTLHCYAFGFADDYMENLKDIYYGGTEEDWKKIKTSYYCKDEDDPSYFAFTKKTFMNSLKNVTIHYTAVPKTELKITQQPTAVTAKNGATVTFMVTVAGDGLTYQWQLSDDQGKNWRNSSTKTATYSATLSSKNDGRYVRCIVTDKYGAKVTSNAASMKMTSLKLTAQPVSITAKNNAWLTFTVKASGEGLTYQWQLSDDQGKTWRNSSTKTATYNTTLTTKNSGRYIRCVVTDKYGLSVKSNAAYMKVTSLKITEQPVAVTAKSGDLVTFDVKAQGPGIAYQWQLSDDQGKTWRNSKATTPSYSTTLSSANSGRYLRCIVTDKYGNSVKSNAVYMKISSLKITGQPANATGKKGSLVSFKVTANGPGISYTWQLSDDAGKTWRNSKNTTSTYATTLSDLNNGRYVRCIVTDKYGNRLYSNAASMKIK